MKHQINIGILGLGTVGTGTLRILRDNAELIRRRVGVPIEVTRIAVRNIHADRGITVDPALLTANPAEVVENPDIDIVVEVMGGEEPARQLILTSIARGKHVVTANKALLAAHGTEIHTAAHAAGVAVGFEASVAGGIPVIKTLKEALAGNRILSVYGIINGTSNYILTKMTEEGRSFSDVLAEAQHAGYAEADPTFDIGGIDTAHKLAILVNLAFDAGVAPDDIFTEGITAITPLDIDFGRTLGYKVKLLAIAKMHGEKVEARVHPTMVPDGYPIAKVGGVYNAIQIVGDACQDIMLYGRGAGALPTGSAVVADIMDISRQISAGTVYDRAKSGTGGHFSGFRADAIRRPLLQEMDSVTSVYYLRLMALDRPGVLSQISGILGQHRISIAQMIQRGRKEGGSVPLVIMTHTALESDVRKALVEIKSLSCVTEEPVLIRVEEDEP